MSDLSFVCAQDEDVKVLGAMAATLNYDPLIRGEVDPRYMNAPCQGAALWLLDQYQDNPQSWPPSLEAMRLQFPLIPWPTAMTSASGLTVDKFVERFNAQARSYQATQVAIAAMDTGSARSSGSGAFDVAIHQTELRLAELRAIGRPGNSSRRLGEDSDKMFATILGDAKRSSRISLPWESLNSFIKNYYSGIYAFFARPKEGKSHLLMTIACHLGLELGLPGVYVDVENDDEVIATRMACISLGINADMLEDLKMRRRLEGDTFRPSAWEIDALSLISDTCVRFQQEGRLHYLSKTDIDPVQQGIGVRKIFDLASRIGAEWICIDQAHLYYVEGICDMRKDAVTRIHRVADALDKSSVPVFITTQERKNKASGKAINREMEEHFPQDEDIFGADAFAQKCSFLAHVRNVRLSEGTPYTDKLGFQRHARYLQCIWPISNRVGDKAGIDDRVFRLVDNYSFEVEMSNEDGTLLMNQELQRRREAYNFQQGKGAKGKGGQAQTHGIPPGTIHTGYGLK